MSSGYLSLVLHAHLPFVRHPEYDEFLEEDWLYEAITETYIPLINMMDGLLDDGVDFRLTMSLTPPLCAMLRDPLLQDRYVRFLERLIELTKKEIDRTRFDQPFHELAWFYHHRLQNCRYVFCDKYGKNLVGAFRKFQDAGKLEIITCGATHGFLPLMTDYPESIRAQIMVARDDYRECFGRDPRGIWLPECAYVPGVEKFLQEAEIRWFIIDTHGVLYAEPRPRLGVFAPIFTRSGPAAFGRDMDSSKQVWSAKEGYPGDGEYRDFYRDVGFDLEYDYIRPYIQSNGLRKFTGIKYHRITGRTHNKEPYRPWAARERAAMHAGNFMFNRERQIEHLSRTLKTKPIIISPYDAELFGHWWFEGPEFLNFLFRKIAYDQNVFSTITPGEYLIYHNTHVVATPSASSWGNKGYWEVWLEGSNNWIYPHLHVAAGRMTELARKFRDCYGQTERAMKQAARELLLAQSSDWAFIMKTGTMVPYAVKRTKDHLMRFTRLYDQIMSNQIDEAFLGNCEWRDNIFPNINWRYYI
ncbi:MAG: 1,4-alpha-glucan branching protein domain-containing protein [bacterium]